MQLAVSTNPALTAAWTDSFNPTAAFWVVLAFYLMLMAAGTVVTLVMLPRMINQPQLWQRRVRWLAARPWRWSLAIFLTLALVGIQLLVAFAVNILRRLTGWPLDPDSVQASLWHGLTFQGMSLVLLAVFLWLRGWSWARALGLRLSRWARQVGMGLVMYACVLPLFFSAAALSRFIMLLLDEPATVQDVMLIFMEPQSVWNLVGLLILAVVLAPLAEEILFRGILLPLLVRHLGAGAGVCLSAILFALVHFHLPSTLPLFILAVGLSLAYIYTRSLLVPIVMHALFNGLNLALLLLAGV